jgi:putative ABC transport system permease protein
VYRFAWISGSSTAFANLGVDDVLLEQDTARAARLAAGDHTTLLTGGGQRVPVTVRGIYRDPGLLRGAVVPAAEFAVLFHQPRLEDVFVKLGPGASRPAALAALRTGLRQLPGVVARPQAQLASQVENRVFAVVGLFYALLALSLVMSLAGIAGTLSLSVHEGTHELGLLRALGMSAAQARSLVRDLSLMSATVGTLTGAVLGLVLGWALTRALAPEGLVFAFPGVALAAGVGVGLAAGLLAAVPPARRVSRLDILSAIAYE